MYYLQDLYAHAPVVAQVVTLLLLAFTVWMLVDAYRNQADSVWFWVILLFQPLGAWIYFFAVKLRNLRLPHTGSGGFGGRRLSLDEMRFRVERTPTVANRLALAEVLMHKKLHAEAVPHLEAILVIEPEYCAALHALAECRLASGDAEQAVGPLEKLIKRDHRWGNYRAWRTLVDVHLARGQPAEALKACRELEKHQPTLENQCLLAEHLLDNDLQPEAVRLLEQALEEYHYAPWGARWRNWRWAREARRLLATAETVGANSQAG